MKLNAGVGAASGLCRTLYRYVDWNQVDENGKRIPFYVVPYIGTWIETFENAPELGKEFVVPYIGTWIETELVEELNAINLVVPYIGTWIETSYCA